jgi:AcrR family transcriptional regulator
MKAAGFTHGAFYNHFSSKAALAAEAASSALKHSNSKLSDALMDEQSPGSSGLAKFVERYLSPEHRDRSAPAHNLRSLERDRLVAAVVDLEKRRNRHIKLTKSGESKLRESVSLWQKAQNRFQQGFGTEQASALPASLALVASIEFEEKRQQGVLQSIIVLS